MTRTRRIVGAGMATLATLAALALTGQALAAEYTAAASAPLSPERMIAATGEPDGGNGGRGRGGYGYGATTPPAGEQPSTPPGSAAPTPPGSAAPTPPASAAPSPTGVSSGNAPVGGGLPVTGSPMAALALLGGVLAVTGVALRYLARRRPC